MTDILEQAKRLAIREQIIGRLLTAVRTVDLEGIDAAMADLTQHEPILAQALREDSARQLEDMHS